MNQVLKRIVVLITVLTATNMIYAQGIAGPDRYIPLKQGEPDLIELSVSAGTGTCCFQWTTTDGEIVGDADKQTIRIKPKSPKSTFHVTRACASGTVEDDVDVYYQDFDIVNVIPKRYCYKANEMINLDDFIITTNPAGYEKSVKNDEGRIQSIFPPISVRDLKITFYENYGVRSEKSVVITVVDESMKISVSKDTNQNLFDLENRLNTVFEKVKSIGELIEKIKLPKSEIGCKPKFETKIGITGTLSTSCCKTEITNPISVEFSASTSMSLDCTIPIGTFWKLIDVNAIFGASADASVGASFTIFKCDEKGRVSFSIRPKGTIYGGLQIIALSKDLLEASATLNGYLSMTDLQFTLLPFTYGSFKTCASADVKLKAKFFSFVKYEKTMKLCEGCWWSGK